MDFKMGIMIMSGVDDGTLMEYKSDRGDGQSTGDKWTLSIGRRDENDICLRNDTYVSREHANLHWKNEAWWLEDCDSTNGTFLATDSFFEDDPVKGIVPLQIGQLFRVGRTWLRLHSIE